MFLCFFFVLWHKKKASDDEWVKAIYTQPTKTEPTNRTMRTDTYLALVNGARTTRLGISCPPTVSFESNCSPLMFAFVCLIVCLIDWFVVFLWFYETSNSMILFWWFLGDGSSAHRSLVFRWRSSSWIFLDHFRSRHLSSLSDTCCLIIGTFAFFEWCFFEDFGCS